MSQQTRPLSQTEAELVRYLLTHFDDAIPYFHQLADLKIVGTCGCGCPSIDFLPDSPEGKSLPIADFSGKTSDGVEVGGMLWIREGRLSSLEVYQYGSEPSTFGLPTVASIRPFPKTPTSN